MKEKIEKSIIQFIKDNYQTKSDEEISKQIFLLFNFKITSRKIRNIRERQGNNWIKKQGRHRDKMWVKRDETKLPDEFEEKLLELERLGETILGEEESC